MSRQRVIVLILILIFDANGCSHAQDSQATRSREPIIGLPCEGCDAVFEELPDTLAWYSTITPPDEPGQKMRIEGTVFDSNGHPASGVIVYIYHTNAKGVYPTDERLRGQSADRHGRLRGWVKTDEQGQYRFETIRPAGYPNTDIPAHVHMHVIEVGRCTYYIDDIMFEDDPRLTTDKRNQLTSDRGGNGVIWPRQDADGIWIVIRDIFLGERISGYPEDA